MKINNKLTFLAASLLAVAFSGCLKDKDYDNGVIQSLRNQADQKIVSIGLTATSTDNHQVLAFDNSDNDTTFNLVPVQVAEVNGASQDITVKVAIDSALIGNYNAISQATTNPTNHDVAPSSVYTILNPGNATDGYEVTIPKGSNTGYISVKLKSADYLGFDYAIGFKIIGVTPGYLISTNLGTGITALAIKNEWDGIYSYKGYSLRAGDAALTGNFSGKEMGLVTAGASSVSFAKLALWGDGNTQISIGNVILNIDKSVPAPYPVALSSTGPTVGRNNPGYSSIYDPTSKTFFISFTWGAGPAARLSTDTLTYLRAR